MTRAELLTVTLLAAAVLGAFVWDSGILQAAFGALRPLAGRALRRRRRPSTSLLAEQQEEREAEAFWHGEPVLGDRMIADVRAHADAMHQINLPYLPEVPYVPVHDRTLPRLTTPDHAPWSTCEFPAVDEDGEIEAMRREYIASSLRERERNGGEITAEFMDEVAALARELPVEAAS